MSASWPVAEFKTILAQLGGDPLYGDNLALTLHKIVDEEGGDSSYDDGEVDSLKKWLGAIGGDPLYSDTAEATLKKILDSYGGESSYQRSFRETAQALVTQTMVPDTTPPVVTSATADFKTVVVHFNERVTDPNTIFIIRVNGDEYPHASRTGSGTRTLTYTLVDGLLVDDVVTLDCSCCIFDRAGNEIEAFTDKPVTNNTVLPFVTGRTISANGLTLSFNFNRPVTGHAGYKLFLEGDELPITYASGDGTTSLNFTPDDGALWKDYVYTASYGSGNTADSAGNALDSFSDESVTNNSTYVPDFAAPTLTSATIDSTGLVLTLVFNEAVDGHAGFTLSSAGGRTLTYTSGETTSTLVFAISSAVTTDLSPTLNYTPGDVEDLSPEGPNALEAFSATAITNGSEVEPTGVPLNALQTFEAGSDGDPITPALLNASETGDAWTWTANRNPAAHSYIETTGKRNYAVGEVTVEGSAVSGTGTRCLKQDHAEAASENLTPIYDAFNGAPPEDITKLVISGFIYLGASGASSHTHDHIKVNGSPYIVLQQQLGSGGGTAGKVHVETQHNGGSTHRSISLDMDVGLYHYELWWNTDNGDMGVIFRDASDLSVFVGCTYVLSNDASGFPLTNVVIQDYLTPESGYTLHDEFGRTWKVGDFATPLFPVTIPAPSSVTLAQTLASTVALTFDDNNAKGTYKIEIHDGVSWTTLETAFESYDLALLSGVYTKDSLVDGTTYKMRVTSQMGDASSTAVESNTVTINNGSAPLAQDNFDSYGDGTDLGDAANWTKATSNDLTVFNPAGSGTIGQGGGSAQNLVYWSADVFSADQRSEATVTAVGGGFERVGVAVRIQSGAATGYGLSVSGSEICLFSVVAGTRATIIEDLSASVSAGHKIALEATGSGTSTRLNVQIDTGSGWVTKWSNQNPAADIDGGQPGLCGDYFNGAGRVDDWKGFEI